MHVVNQWRRYKWKSTWLFAETANVSPASTAAKTSGKSMWICPKCPDQLWDRWFHKAFKKKKRARGKFEERKLRKKCSACQDHLLFKADAKRRLRKKGVAGLVVIWWVRGTCWPVLGTVTGAREVSMRSRVSRCAVLITGKRWIYRPENEVMHPQWRSLGEETRSSPRKSEVMEGVKPLAPSEAGASSEGVSGEGRTEGTGQGGSCPSSVSQGGSSAVGYSHSCTDCLQLQRVQLLACGPYWPL